MKIDFPSEVWVAIFESLSREQLAALIPHLGDEQKETKNRPIANHEFVENVRYYLHKCGNATLGPFSIESSRKGPVFVNKEGQKWPLAKMPRPMPSNIKSFKQITINYYDQSVLDFLQEFGRNSPFTNVNLELHGENHRKFDAMSKVMAQLLPSITSIESLRSYDYDHNAALFQEELSDMLTSARILNGSHFGVGSDDWYRHWLHIPRDDGKPRIMLATNVRQYVNGIYPIYRFIKEIKKDFLDANQAVSFFACILGKHEAENLHQSISLDNDKTKEKLVIEGIGPRPEHFVTISRYPMGATEEWINEVWKIVDDMLLGWLYQQEKKIEVDLNLNIKSGCFACSLI